jgi:general secretion pathway protein D
MILFQVCCRTLPVTLGGVTLAVMLAGCAAPDPLAAVRPMLAEGDVAAAIAHLESEVRRNPDAAGSTRVTLLRLRESGVRSELQVLDGALRSGDMAAAAIALERAESLSPDSRLVVEARSRLERKQRADAALARAEQALAEGQLEAARGHVGEALAMEPGVRAAERLRHRIEGLLDMRSAAEEPKLKLLDDKPVSLEFREAPVKQLFEALSRSTGMSFVFDQDVRRDAKVTLMLQGVRVSEALRVIGQANRLGFKILGERALLVYPATPAKRNEYRQLMVRSFSLSNAAAKDVANTLRSVLKARDVTPDDKTNTVVMRDTPQMMRMAERLIAMHDTAEPEVMLEVEVLEVSRSELTKLGLVGPQSIGIGVPNSVGNYVLGAEGLRASVANPALLLNLRQRDNLADLLANPRIRVKNRGKARIHIGEKVPVVTTTATANVGVSSSVNYLDVGLKLDVEPQIHLDDEVSIGLKLEVSNIIETITVGSAGGGSTIAYRLGTRNTETSLRLRDGETQVLAGLIQNDQRRSRARIPGLGNLPIIGRLFSSDDGDGSTRSKTEVVLLITPRILRTVEPIYTGRAGFEAGTAGEVGAAPLLLESDLPGVEAGSGAIGGGLTVSNPTAAEVEAGALATQPATEGVEGAPPAER